MKRDVVEERTSMKCIEDDDWDDHIKGDDHWFREPRRQGSKDSRERIVDEEWCLWEE